MTQAETGKIKILIVKLGALGDAAMALPMIEALRKRYANADITWLCGKTIEPVLKLVEGIDTIITIDDELLFKGSLLQRLIIIAHCWKIFLFKKFDFVFTPYRDKRYKLLTLTARSNIARSFMGQDRINSITPGRYHSVEYVKLVTGNDNSKTGIPTYPKLNIPADAEIDNIFNEINTKYIALVPGGAKNLLNEDSLRNWDVKLYAALAGKLIAAGSRVIILGAKSDEWICDSFKGTPVINLVSKTSIPQLMNVLAKINLLISHDTGILHLGKLTNTPSIALFGPVNPLERIGKDDNITVISESEKLPCAPCYDGKNFAPCTNNLCMKNISVEQVFTMATNLLN